MTQRNTTQVLAEVEILDSAPDRQATQVVAEVEVSNVNVDRQLLTIVAEVEIVAGAATPETGYPGAIFQMDWVGDGSWVDETENVLSLMQPVEYSYGLMSPGGSLSALGDATAAQMTLLLENEDGRYSESHAGSQAATFGLFQVPVRLRLGWAATKGGVPDLNVIFRGRVAQGPYEELAATIALTCYGHDHDIAQQRPELAAASDQRTDELVASMATAITYADTDLDRGYTVVPWFYADRDNCLEKMRDIAEAEGALVWVDPQDATLKFWGWAHWVNAAVAAFHDEDTFDNVVVQPDYRQAFDAVSVTYGPRRRGRLMNLHKLTEPIVIPTGGNVTRRLRLRYPMAQFDSYSANARTSGGVNLNSDLTVAPSAPQTAYTWEVTLTNGNITYPMVVDNLDVMGRPIEGLPNREHQVKLAVLRVPRQTDVEPTELRGRYALQHEAQAALVAGLKAFRLQTPPRMLTIGPMDGDSTLHVGDVIAVDLSGGISQINEAVVLLHRKGRYSNTWTETWLGVPVASLYEYTTASTGVGDGYHVVGTSRLSFGRLGY